MVYLLFGTGYLANLLSTLFIYIFNHLRQVANITVGAKLIFSSMGDNNYPSHGCWAYKGNVGSVGGENGQTVNLSFDCLTVGTVIHEVMHSLGRRSLQNKLF